MSAPELRGARTVLFALALAATLGLAAFAPAAQPSERSHGPAAGHAAIRRANLERHLDAIAGLRLEGRDSPSPGLRRAAEYVSTRFRELGLEPAPDALSVLREFEPGLAGPGETSEGTSSGAAPNLYLRPFTRPLEAPVLEECELVVVGAEPFVAGRDFVPVAGCKGSAEGELVFAGFGIEDKKERYDDFARLRLAGKVAVIFEGAPRHARRFGGEGGSETGSLWNKLPRLVAEKVAGVIVIRRPLEDHPDYEFEYRYGFAFFADEPIPRAPPGRPPVIEVSYDAATRLLGRDARALAAQMDRSVRPSAVDLKGARVQFRATTALREVRVDNVVGVLRGSDPTLADDYVVVGAHYDHVGVDLRGRVGPGADDNGSGTSALLEVAAALAAAGPRRSILVCAFGAEEAGLLGSAAFTRRLPVPRTSLAAMVNLDMIGRGEAREVAVLGADRNRHLAQVLERAAALSPTGVREVVTGRGNELWNRSDHYNFHKIGVPSLFFFEGLPITRNPDYHTWRDTLDKLDLSKIENTTRLVFNTVWLLATDDARPPASRD